MKQEPPEKIRNIVEECLHPRYKFYVNGHTLLIHRKDADRNLWGFVKLALSISSTGWIPNWKIDVYENDIEFVLKAMEGDTSGDLNGT